MSLSILPLHHDYLPLSLTNIRSTVVVVEKIVVDIRVVEEIDAVVVEEESFSAEVER